LITGLIHEPSKHRVSELDLTSFGKLYEFCMNRKVTIEGQGTQNFTLECNGVLTSGTRKIDAINSVLATCDGGLYINEFGQLEVYYEDTQVTPIALLNPQRIISMVDQRSLDRKSDGYNIEIIDQDSDFLQKTYRILRPNIKVDSGLNTYVPMKLDFTTSYNQAMWHARRLLAKEEHRPGELKVTVGKEGRYYKPRSLIKVQHERFKIGLGSGEITQLIRDGDKIVGLKLMERFDISSERDYWIEYYVVDDNRNHVVTKQIQSVGQYTDRLMFTVPLDTDSEDIPAFGNILSTMYSDRKNTGRVWEAKRYIVTGLSENSDGYELTLAEYAEDIYGWSEISEIQERKSSILNAPPVVFADQQLNELNLFLEAIRAQTTPQNIDNIARGVFEGEIDKAVSEKAPRFRGVYFVAGLLDGTINKDKMNPDDYIYYAGASTGVAPNRWEQYYIYQWTDAGWKLRPRPSTAEGTAYGWMYLNAANSIAEGAPIGTFSNVFCQALVATKAFIDSLFARNIEIEYGGSIKTQGFTDRNGSTPGFKLVYEKVGNLLTGLIEANNIKTKDMNAIGGIFNSINVTGESTFSGTITAGIIKAAAISVDGSSVRSGNSFILKSNNNLVRSYLSTVPIKEILTYATGTCRIVLLFPVLPSNQGINAGKYKITKANVNNSGETIIIDWTDYMQSTVLIPVYPITLDLNPTKINLYLDTRDLGGQQLPVQINATFELRCADDPGILMAF